ncbi:unnamed protein product [Tilletia controversa]|nr:unnamed protein product [Tilletia controversa]
MQLAVRSGPPILPDNIGILGEIYRIHEHDLNRFIAEAYRAGFHQLARLPPSLEGEARRVLAGLDRSEEGMNRVVEELNRLAAQASRQA